MNSFVSAASSLACCVAGPDLGRGGQDLAGARRRARRRTRPAWRATAISSSLPCLPKSSCAVRQVEAGERGAADRRDGAEADEARDAEPARGPLGLNANELAELEVLLVGRRPVDHDLAVARPGAVDERERIERRVALGDAEAEVRRAAVDDRLAVVADQLRLAVDAALGVLDVGQRAHLARAATRRGWASPLPVPSERSNAVLPADRRRSSPGGRR